MRGFPILGRGQPVMLEGCTGIVYKESPGAEARSIAGGTVSFLRSREVTRSGGVESWNQWI